MIDPDVRMALRAPFPAELISKTDKGFGPVDTLNHAVVTDRLLRVVPDFTYGIDRFVEVEGKDGMLHLLAVYGWMEIDGVRRYEVGEVERPSTYGDECKKAISDFIKRAAMRFGVGLDLWAKEDLQAAAGTTDPGVPWGATPPPAPGPDGQTPSGAAAAGPPARGEQGGPADTSAGPGGSRRTERGREDAGDGHGEGAAQDPSVRAPIPGQIAGPKEWSDAARRLKTTRPLAQQQVLAFFKNARVDIRSLEQVTTDDLDWATGSIVLGRQAAVTG